MRADAAELRERATRETRKSCCSEPRRCARGDSPPGGAGARLPTAAWICFAVALLNGIAWGLITPLFQAPDEAGHVAYVQHVAETGKPPTGKARDPALLARSSATCSTRSAGRRSSAERTSGFRGPPPSRSVSSGTSVPSSSRISGGGYTTDTNNPPLYYFAAAGVYHLSPWTSLPDRVHFLRLFSALLAACTVLFVFLFLRELLPSTPWAWTVGALAVAFQPMFGFTASGVTSDTVLYPASAGIFYTLALAFRRGLTPRRGLAIGALRARSGSSRR